MQHKFNPHKSLVYCRGRLAF